MIKILILKKCKNFKKQWISSIKKNNKINNKNNNKND